MTAENTPSVKPTPLDRAEVAFTKAPWQMIKSRNGDYVTAMPSLRDALAAALSDEDEMVRVILDLQDHFDPEPREIVAAFKAYLLGEPS